MYLQNTVFVLQSDHKPLIPLINNKNLADAPIRCQRLLMRLARYSPKAEYVPGKYMVVADTLSRDVYSVAERDDCNNLTREIKEFEVLALTSLPISRTRLETIALEQERDEKISRVREYVLEGWPSDVEDDLLCYYKSRGELSIVGNMLIFQNRIVIPSALRDVILKRIHDDGHLSLNKCRKRVQESVWWPYISKELACYIERCSFCQINRRCNRAEPLRPTKLPERPWEQIALDLFELEGEKYLIVVDYFSRWFEVVPMKKIDSESVISALKRIFACFGIPEIVKSDRGLQFNSLMFRNFASEYDFKLLFSDPFYPQGNGCAERAVQVAKRLYRQPNPLVALMSYRTTPLDTTGYSPSQLLMGRSIRTKLPTLPQCLAPGWPDMDTVRNNDAQAKKRTADLFNRRKGVRKLPALTEGQQVRIRLPQDKQWSQSEKVLQRRGETSYAIRNRRYLQPIPEPMRKEDEHQGNLDRGEASAGGPVSGGGSDENVHNDPSPPVSSAEVENDNANSLYKTRFGRIVKPVLRYQS